MNSILVTGGAGFIGSHLCETLLRQGRHVVLFDNFNDFYSPAIKMANLEAVRRTAAETEGHLTLLRGDLRSPGDLRRAFLALGSSDQAAVVHLAAMAGVRPSIENPLLYNQVNVTGTLNLLEECRRSGVKRLAFASSSSVYGNNEKTPFAETDPVSISSRRPSTRCMPMPNPSRRQTGARSSRSTINCLRSRRHRSWHSTAQSQSVR